MIALHLNPIHNALALRYLPLGWTGRYEVQAMTLENGRWLRSGDATLIDRDALDTLTEENPVASEFFEFRLAAGFVTIRHRGGMFGKCKIAGLHEQLERAREDATGRSDGRISDTQDRPVGETRLIPIEQPGESIRTLG